MRAKAMLNSINPLFSDYKVPNASWIEVVSALGNVANKLTTKEALKAYWQSSLSGLGIEFLQYCTVRTDSFDGWQCKYQFTLGDDRGWDTFYQAERFYRDDPLMRLARDHSLLNWNDFIYRDGLTGREASFRKRLERLGFTHGASVLKGETSPISAYFSLAYSAKAPKFCESEWAMLIWAFYRLHKRYLVLSGSVVLPSNPLSPREQEIGRLLTQGMKNTQIAEALGLSKYTVSDYIKSIYLKIKVSNRTDAGLTLIEKGYV